VKQGSVEASLMNSQNSPAAQVAALQTSLVPPSSQSLDAAQLQALPLSGRNWQSFVLDASSLTDEAGEHPGPSSATAMTPQITLDGTRLQSAFGSTDGGRNQSRAIALLGPASAESALRELQPGGLTGTASESGDPGRTVVETQRRTDHLHGQAFLFDHQNLWNARNPFTQWVQETSPATATTIPVFTAES
jgi:hypothetical protein